MQPSGKWPPRSVEDFEQAHKDLYSGIVTGLKALGIAFSDRRTGIRYCRDYQPDTPTKRPLPKAAGITVN